MIRLERVFFSELNSQVKNREISWARATDAVKSTLLMSNFRINENNILVKTVSCLWTKSAVKGGLFKPTEMLECRQINISVSNVMF